MRLDVHSIGEIQSILKDGNIDDALNSVSCSEMTLAAAIDLSRAALSVENQGRLEEARALKALFPSPTLFNECSRMWRQRGPLSLGSDIHGTRSYELFPIHSREALTQTAWHPFEARFARSLKQAGFDARLADGLVDALNEMADNAIQHSGVSPESPARSVVGYGVDSGRMSFVICDTGRGAFASLQANPLWNSLKNNREALCAIIEQQATRVTENSYGDGYRTMFRTLSDHNARIRLRSQDSFYELYSGSGGRMSQSGEAPEIAGFQILISCSTHGDAEEVNLH